jgi:uncharacterized Ntn-hydrolase superfamily protein
VKPEGWYAGYNDRWIDYRVDDHEYPVPCLIDLLELHHLYFGKSPAEEELAIEGEICLSLQSLMTNLGYMLEPPSGSYDDATRSALRKFLGNENFEERADFEAGRIDAPVYQFLIRKFGG